MDKYKEASSRIQDIFHRFTYKVETLALDEAYLDVTDSDLCNGSATLIAGENNPLIKRRAREDLNLRPTD